MPKARNSYELNRGLGPTDDLLSPVWTLRLFPILSLLALCLALWVFRFGIAHNSCLLFAAMMLGPVILLSWQMSAFTLRRPAERSDVEDRPITR